MTQGGQHPLAVEEAARGLLRTDNGENVKTILDVGSLPCQRSTCALAKMPAKPVQPAVATCHAPVGCR